MTNPLYYSIKVKDTCGDTMRYISDYPPQINEDTGLLEIYQTTDTVYYNPERVVCYTVEEKDE